MIRRSALAGISLFTLLMACSSKTGSPPFIRTSATSDLAAFTQYVNLPERPKAVTFETFFRARPSSLPAPNDWYLMAVLTYDQPSLYRLEQQAQRQKGPVLLDAEEIRPWFPPDVRNILVKEASGQSAMRGPAFHADAFLKPPLNDGEFTVAGPYLFLQLDCCGPR